MPVKKTDSKKEKQLMALKTAVQEGADLAVNVVLDPKDKESALKLYGNLRVVEALTDQIINDNDA